MPVAVSSSFTCSPLFLSLEAVFYLFWFVHVCVCVDVSSRQYLGVWGELASYNRSSTHRPSSQGWASKCLVLSVFVGMVLVAYIYMGLWASPFFCLYLAGVLYACDFMYIQQSYVLASGLLMCLSNVVPTYPTSGRLYV